MQFRLWSQRGLGWKRLAQLCPTLLPHPQPWASQDSRGQPQSQAQPIMLLPRVQCKRTLCTGAPSRRSTTGLFHSEEPEQHKHAADPGKSLPSPPRTACPPRCAEHQRHRRHPASREQDPSSSGSTYLHHHHHHHCLGSLGCDFHGLLSHTAVADRPLWAGPP